MTPREIVSRGCQVFGLTPQAVVGRGRSRYLAWARQGIALALAEACPGLSDEQIAQLLGRERSTVSYGIAQARRRREQNPLFAAKMAELLPTRVAAAD